MKILSVSTNNELRTLRHFVLESAGFEVQSPQTHIEAAQIASEQADINIFIICHTIAKKTAGELTESFRQTRPGSRVIVLTRTDWESLPVEADMRIVASDGPEKLIEGLVALESSPIEERTD